MNAIAEISTSNTLMPAEHQKKSALQSRHQLLKMSLVAWCSTQSISINQAIKLLLEGNCPSSIKAICTELKVSRTSLYNWCNLYKTQGSSALMPNWRNGQKRIEKPEPIWQKSALKMYQQPQKHSLKKIYRRLSRGGVSFTYAQLRNYINSLPVNETTEHPDRVGKRHAKNNLQHYNSRYYEGLPAGHYWCGDGHTVDCYIAHPVSNQPYRPEVTVFMDMRSRLVVGYHLSRAESAISTLQTLSKAMLKHDHVPPVLLLDNGSGFKAYMMNNQQFGWFNAMGVEIIFAIPGNPKSKPVERFFRTYKEELDKDSPSYCGHDMAADALREYLRDVKQGKKQLPSYDEYSQALAEFIEVYNNEHQHSALGGDTPAQHHAKTFIRYPLNLSPAELTEVRQVRKVVRGAVTLDGRQYRHVELLKHNGREVVVGYQLDDDAKVSTYINDQLICIASLFMKIPALPESRIKQQQEKAAKEAIKRHQKHINRIKAESKETALIQHEDSNRLMSSLLGFKPQQDDELASKVALALLKSTQQK